MTKYQYQRAWYALVGVLAFVLGCSRSAEKADSDQAQLVPATLGAANRRQAANESSRFAVGNSLAGVREPHVAGNSEVTELMTHTSSAYTAGLFADDYAAYLLTDRVAFRLELEASPQQIPIENGSAAAVTRSGIVYWAKGAIWQVPSSGGEARWLATLPHQPQHFLTDGDSLAWLDMPERDHFLIQTLDRGKVRTLVDYAGRIETADMDAGHVFFVRRDSGSSWRIGSVSVGGGAPTYASPKTGPTPAKLAVAGDLFYYDVKSVQLRRLSADLSREQTLLEDLVCSPLAVGVRIYCPNMDGLFEMARHRGAKPMPLFPSRRRITSVAASSRFLVWLEDAGPERLTMELIHLVLDDPLQPD